MEQAVTANTVLNESQKIIHHTHGKPSLEDMANDNEILLINDKN